MSYNAIALNRVLASNVSQLGTINESGYPTARRRVDGGYGAFGASQFRNTDGMNSVTYGSVIGSRYGTTVASNLWGVPELSDLLLNEDDTENETHGSNIPFADSKSKNNFRA